MSFYINTQQTGDVAVLQCIGRMVHARALSLLKDVEPSSTQLRVVVLDLSEVEVLDPLAALGCWSLCITGLARMAFS